MLAKRRFCHDLSVGLLLRLLLVTTILVAPLHPTLTPPAAAAPGVLQNILDFLSLGANTVRELQKAIRLASGEMKAILEGLKRDIEAITAMLEQKFQHNLNVALSTLDEATRTILLQLESQIITINALLQEDIQLIGKVAQETIRDARLQIQRAFSDLEQSLQRSVLWIGITGTFLIDRATENVILIIAIVMLGLGLLAFIWLLFTRHMPSGLAQTLVFVFVVVHFGLFGSLVIPPVRGYAMTLTGIGLEKQLQDVAGGPRVIDVFPDTIVLGETTEVDIWGSMLRPEGKTPTATIAGSVVPVRAAVDNRVVVDVAHLQAPIGRTALRLVYDGREGPGFIVMLVMPKLPPVPADLVLKDFRIEPSSPVQEANTQATITVCNRGGSLARTFVVQWKPTADHPGLSFKVPGADVGECPEAHFPTFAYPHSGTFDTVAIADAFNVVPESDKANNSRAHRITVQPVKGEDPPPSSSRPPPRLPDCPPSRPICCGEYDGPKEHLSDGRCFLCVPHGVRCPLPR